jgi:hypothetical protein
VASLQSGRRSAAGTWTLLVNAEGPHQRGPLTCCYRDMKLIVKKEGRYPRAIARGFTSPREKRQGPASFPGASLMLGCRDSPRASLVPLTCPRVSSLLSPYSRPSPTHRHSTGLVIVVCNPRKGPSGGFCERGKAALRCPIVATEAPKSQPAHRPSRYHYRLKRRTLGLLLCNRTHAG